MSVFPREENEKKNQRGREKSKALWVTKHGGTTGSFFFGTFPRKMESLVGSAEGLIFLIAAFVFPSGFFCFFSLAFEKPQVIPSGFWMSAPEPREDGDEHQSSSASSEEGEEHSESSSLSEENTDDSPVFTTDEEADTARKEGLGFYNTGKYDDALKLQCGVLKYKATKFGDLDPQCALYYLDYGMTLLAVIQSRDSEAAMLNSEEDEKDISLCFVILDAARICYEKQEKSGATTALDGTLLWLRLAETHDALAQVQMERDDEEAAAREFEFALSLRQAAPHPDSKLIAATLFSIGSCHLRSSKYPEAIATFNKALEHRAALDAALVEEINGYLEEAKELEARGGIEDLKEEIHACFPDEASQVHDPAEVLGQPAEDGMHAAPASAFVTPLPPELRAAGVHSVSMSLMNAVPLADAGHSNSISFLPIQGSENSRSFIQLPDNVANAHSRPVNSVTVRKKPKTGSTDNSMSVPVAAAQQNGGSPRRASQQPAANTNGHQQTNGHRDASTEPPTKRARKE